MKKVLIVLIAVLSLASCSPESEAIVVDNEALLEGTWRLDSYSFYEDGMIVISQGLDQCNTVLLDFDTVNMIVTSHEIENCETTYSESSSYSFNGDLLYMDGVGFGWQVTSQTLTLDVEFDEDERFVYNFKR
jgi:hypothetical protein